MSDELLPMNAKARLSLIVLAIVVAAVLVVWVAIRWFREATFYPG
jgi:hypothetical protein